MATIKTYYVVQSCPICKTELLRVQQGTKDIGSPLVTCPRCSITFRTDMREEWYRYQPKWVIYVLPLIIAAIAFLVGAFKGEPSIGILAAFLGLIIGIVMGLVKVPAIIRSKKRMKDPAYIAQLLKYEIITQAEHDELLQNATK